MRCIECETNPIESEPLCECCGRKLSEVEKAHVEADIAPVLPLCASCGAPAEQGDLCRACRQEFGAASEVSKAVTSEADALEAVALEAAALEAAALEAAKPEAAKPEAVTSEFSTYETSEPEIAKAEITQTDTAKLESARLENARAEAAKLKAETAKQEEERLEAARAEEKRLRALEARQTMNSVAPPKVPKPAATNMRPNAPVLPKHRGRTWARAAIFVVVAGGSFAAGIYSIYLRQEFANNLRQEFANLRQEFAPVAEEQVAAAIRTEAPEISTPIPQRMPARAPAPVPTPASTPAPAPTAAPTLKQPLPTAPPAAAPANIERPLAPPVEAALSIRDMASEEPPTVLITPPAPRPVAPARVATEPPAQPRGPLFEPEEVNELPRIETRVEPKLPAILQGMNVGDLVIVRLVVSETGRPSRLSVLRPSKLGSPVDEAVIAAVNQWTFSPAKKRGEPVSSWYNVGVPIGRAVVR